MKLLVDESIQKAGSVNLKLSHYHPHSQNVTIRPYGKYAVANVTLAEKIINNTIDRMSEVSLFGNEFPIPSKLSYFTTFDLSNYTIIRGNIPGESQVR